jgi:DNA invertase Pin-like site-specific DNA recombinase
MDDIAARLQARITEVREELARLERARAALDGETTRAHTPRRRRTKAATARRRPRQDRHDVVLKMVSEAGAEGVRTADVKKRLKVSSPTVARVLNELEASKAIKRPKRGTIVAA